MGVATPSAPDMEAIMAGYTPPKDPAQRVRRNKDPRPTLTVAVTPSAGPRELPEDLLPWGADLGERETWHPATLRWWKRWTESPLAERLPEVDWSELEATAVLHHEFMRKRTFTLASELRLRMQKFGATPEDRMRLRILVAVADEKESPAARPAGSAARQRFGRDLAVVHAVGE